MLTASRQVLIFGIIPPEMSPSLSIFSAIEELISEINSFIAEKMLKDGDITGGMIPKINTCLDAVKNGVKGVVIVDGRKPHSILFELFSDKGAGTLIIK